MVAEAEVRGAERVGKVLRDRWTLTRLLGSGGMASVYEATHKLGHKAAIKILHPEVSVAKELRARFQQEAMAAATLDHPGVVRVSDIDATEDGGMFMVMELLEGESLNERARRLGGIERDDLLRYLDEALSALAAAHEAGIVHRDIKPDNIFIPNEGVTKILDFGISRMHQGQVKTRPGAMLGTVNYMAPEQIKGLEVDGRIDLFALGATAYRMLAMRPIHTANSEAELLILMATTQAPQLQSVAPSVDTDLANVVDTALAMSRDARYPDAATMGEDVRALRRGETPLFASRAARRTGGPRTRRVDPRVDPTTLPPPNPAFPREPTPPTRTDFGPAATPVALEPTSLERLAVEPVAPPTPSAVVPISTPTVGATPPANGGSPTRIVAIIAAVALVLGVGIALLLVGTREPPTDVGHLRTASGEDSIDVADDENDTETDELAPSAIPSASASVPGASGRPPIVIPGKPPQNKSHKPKKDKKKPQ